MQPVDITCGNLMLRPWAPYDVESVLAACQDPEIQRWTTVPSPYTPEDARAWVVEVSPALWESGAAATFGIFDATTAEVLGSVGLTFHGADTASVGYWCAPGARNAGVVTEAVQAVCRWGFGALDLDRITWTAEVGNTASRAVAEKCGFTVEGTARRSLEHRGDRVDGWTGSLLRTDEVTDRRPLPAPPVLTDGVVTLRGWTPADAPEAQRACDDPLTAQWLPVPVPYTLADATSYISGYIAGAWADGTAAELAVTDAGTGELLGAMGLKLHNRRLGFGEIGYWTSPWARGRGVAGRGAALSARWGLEVLGLHRVELLADVDNLASQTAALRGGFVQEGVARRSRLDRDGTPRDMVLFSVTAQDLGASGST
jgi:RimJ/RimL family protein N-acetyltransferase